MDRIRDPIRSSIKRYHPNYSGYSMGQPVPVVYDRKDPRIAEIDEPELLWGGIALSYFIGGLFMTVGGGTIVFLLKRGWASSK